MTRRPCLGCGRLIASGSRCPRCRLPKRPSPTSVTRDAVERRRRAEAVRSWREQHGNWCPGWNGYDPHAVVPPNVLTADHVTAVGVGGSPSGPLVVRCRRCNSAKGAKA